MWAIAFGLEEAAGLQEQHAESEEEKCHTPPVELYLFHSEEFVCLSRCECNRKVLEETIF